VAHCPHSASWSWLSKIISPSPFGNVLYFLIIVLPFSSQSPLTAIDIATMGFFSKKRGSNSPASTPQPSPKFGSQSDSRSVSSSPNSPSFPSKPAAKLPPAPDAKIDPEGYLASLQAVRYRSQLVFDKVQRGFGVCFTLDSSKMDDVIKYVVGIIKVRLMFWIG
jgi:hypothetical protein